MSKKGILVAGLLLIALAAVAQYTFGIVGVGAQEMHMEQTPHYISYAVDSSPSFYSNNSRSFFVTTRTGVRHVTSNGETRMSEQFNLTRPHMAIRGDVVAVGEDEGRAIRLFNASGPMNMVTLDNPAQGFFVNASGDLSVIMAVDGGYHVHAYSRNTGELFFRLTFQHRTNPMRFPVAIEVSENGMYIAVAYLDIYRNLETEIEFYSAEQYVRFGTDALFASNMFANEVLLAMRFVSNTQILIITDRRITMQSISGNIVQSDWTIPLYNRIDQIAFDGGRFAIATGASTYPDGRNAEPVGTINIFDTNGLTGTFYLGRRVTHLSMGHNAVIVGADRYFRAINSRGASLWQHTTAHDVRDMIFLDNTNTVLIAGPTQARVWRRVR